MKMSDKDFDQLFNSKLANIEHEPSPMVWDNITAELNGPAKRKKMVIPFMRIAAGVVVLMGASLFFLRPTVQQVTLHGSSTTAQVEPLPVNVVNKAAVTEDSASVNNTSTTTIDNVKHAENASAGIKIKAVKSVVDTAQILAEVNKRLSENANETAIAIQQEENVRMAIANSGNVSQPKTLVPDKQVILANNNMPDQKDKATVRKKRIHSLGDLLNVVIAQVDKRKDKIVEFTNDNDDDSFNITGINLGVLGAKKDK